MASKLYSQLWISAVLICLLSVCSARTWTNLEGGKIEAEFVRMDGNDKVVVNKGGKEYTIPISNLVEENRAWLRENGLKAGNGVAGQKNVPAVTALTRAIRLEKIPEAMKLLSKESVNQADAGGYHPLTYAVYTGDVDLVGALLKAGADPNTVEANGKTALYAAADLAHTEIITLLAKGGAKMPTDNALSPFTAAVISGSIGSVKTLLDHFPNIDPNNSWRLPGGDPRVINAPQNAIDYAVMNGYEDIAIYLLGNRDGARSNSRPAAGTALQYAAEDERCSVDLVKRLIETGLDPMGSSTHPGFDHRPGSRPFDGSPGAAIERAAAAGNLEKIKVMLQGQKVREHSRVIQNAAYYAAFHNQKEASQYLFGLLGMKLPSTKDWPMEAPRTSASTQRKTATNNSPQIDFADYFPRTAAPKQQVEHTGSIAIISPDSLRNYAALLTVALSETGEIKVIERDSLDRALQENSLKALQVRDTKSFHQQLDLIPAEQIVVLSQVGPAKDKLLQYALISTKSGLVSSLIVASQKEGTDLEVLSQIAKQLGVAAEHAGTIADTAVAISNLPVKPSIPSEDSLRLTDLCNTLMPHQISNTAGSVLLSRSQLQHLETEKSIGVEGGYWASAWIIDGSIDTEADGVYRLKLRATNPTNLQSVQAEVAGSEKDFAPLVADAWKALAGQINLDAKDADGQKTPGSKELKFLSERAKWLLQAKYMQEALDLCTTSRALGDTSLDLRITHLKAFVATLYPQNFIISKMRTDPRSAHPQRKYPLTRFFDSYLDLATYSINYLQTPGAAKRSPREVEIVQSVLKNLLLFRCLMDDAIVENEFGNEIRALDIRIQQLTKLYMESVDRHYRVIFLLDTSHYYYERKAPDVLKVILDKVAKCSRRKFKVGDPPVAGDSLVLRVRQLRKRGILVEPWLELLEDMKKSVQLEHQYFGLLGARELASTHAERTQIESKLTRVLSHFIVGPYQSKYLFPPKLVRFSGSEYLEWNGFANAYPRVGFSGIIHDLSEEFLDTGEYRRLVGPYNWFRQIAQYSDQQWEENITNYRKKLGAPNKPSNRVIPPGDWLGLREFAQRDRQLKPAALAQFDAMLPERPKDVDLPELDLGKAMVFSSAWSNPSDFVEARLIESRIIGDQLWTPIFSQSSRKNSGSWKGSIQVMQLSSGKVKTVALPEGSPLPVGIYDFNQWTLPMRLIVADDYVYYPLRGGAKPSRLFAIHRKTFQLKEIPLVLPSISAITWNAVDNTIYASLSRNNAVSGNLNSVIAIKGGEITETLVSNRRVPPLSPLDSPDVSVTLLLSSPGNLRVFSASDQSFMEPGRVKTINYDPKAKKWEALPAGWGKRPRREHLKWVKAHQKERKKAFFTDKWLSSRR